MPNISLSYIDNFFHLVLKFMIFQISLIFLILYAEHSFNASTFAKEITSPFGAKYALATARWMLENYTFLPKDNA